MVTLKFYNHLLLHIVTILTFLQVICKALQNEQSVMLKTSPADLVTETDQKVEKMIISAIKEKFPTHR